MAPALSDRLCEIPKRNMVHMVEEDVGNKNTASVLEMTVGCKYYGYYFSHMNRCGSMTLFNLIVSLIFIIFHWAYSCVVHYHTSLFVICTLCYLAYDSLF